MADIAMVFHWPPDAMDPMALGDLMAWRERARKRYDAQQPRQASGKRPGKR